MMISELQQSYRRLNRLAGWGVFLIAAVVYLSTLEPTASFWDCTEYIACSHGIEVGHPPGAPLFLLIGRLFALLSPSPSGVAWCVNAMSGLCSAFTILFLFWSITHLAKKIFLRHESDWRPMRIYGVLAAGAVGALAYTFSDSFWFSAVEGEVYAMSSLFTAAVFWAMLRWEEEADDPHSVRWIVLIAFLIGLSIGVHLLNLLTIPALVFIWYFRKVQKITVLNFLLALIAAVALLGAVQNGLIPGLVGAAATSEVLFVNKMHLPFNYGTVLYFLLLSLFLVAGMVHAAKNTRRSFYLLVGVGLIFFAVVIGSSFSMERWPISSFISRLITGLGALAVIVWQRHNRRLLSTIFFSVTVLLIGYSSFLVLVIRANAGTPINEGCPKDAVSLLAYLNRDQYGDWPLLYGPYYNTPLDPKDPYSDGTPLYIQDAKTKRYVISAQRRGINYHYDSRYCTFFPRMWNPGAAEGYDSWAQTVGHDVTIDLGKGKTRKLHMPTFTDNMKYFFNYQFWHMYVRYFLWNFAGRQNDVGSFGQATTGNWMSGFPPIDDERLGRQDLLPDNLRDNKASNNFYCIPLFLGIIGMIGHFRRSRKDAVIVLFLFLFTGLSIVLYLNQTPYQPRERDYAYVGSFYAFAIWIGLGVLQIAEWLTRVIKKEQTLIAVSGSIGMLAPLLMGFQGWDDHDRSHRTIARDIGVNYLESCPPNAILFTYADNDTFPLWYAQEVEGVRPDVRIICLSLFASDWYLDQVKQQLRLSAPLPLSMEHDQYREGTRDQLDVYEEWKDTTDLSTIVDFFTSEKNQFKNSEGEMTNYIPARNFSLRVDKSTVLSNGTVMPGCETLVEDSITWRTGKQQFDKGEMAILDILAHNHWQRPICFTTGMPSSSYLGMGNYLQLEGLVYRLVPYRNPDPRAKFPQLPIVNADRMFRLMTTTYRWGGASTPGVYLDENASRFFVEPMRTASMQLAQALYFRREYEKAAAVALLCMKNIPLQNAPPDDKTFLLLRILYATGHQNEALDWAKKTFSHYESVIRYYKEGGTGYVGSDAEIVNNMSMLIEIALRTGQQQVAEDFFARMQALGVQPQLPGDEGGDGDSASSTDSSGQ